MYEVLVVRADGLWVHPIKETFESKIDMKKHLTGDALPAFGKESKKDPKNRTYKKPSGDAFEISKEDFDKVVEIFNRLRIVRDSQSTQVETLEPEISGRKPSDVVERAG